MRLSSYLLQEAEQRTNPLGDRELILRGYDIRIIENMSVAQDMFDTIDLSDNRITTLNNFPKMLRCRSMLLGDNLISHIDANNLSRNVPSLETLVLTNNRIEGLHEVSSLATACPNLENLILTGNPVQRRQYYRLYAIMKMPKLKVLDFEKVTGSERQQAARLAKSAAGAALELDVRGEARLALHANNDSSQLAEEDNTFEPGVGETAEAAFKVSFTPEQKEQIRQMIADASSPDEIERIENMVKRGIFPAAPPPAGGASQATS